MKLTVERFREIEAVSRRLPQCDSGFEINAAIDWQENVGEAENAEHFAREAIFVICNSGMKHTVARRIFNRVMEALECGLSAANGFGHAGKTAAINRIWYERDGLFAQYQKSTDKLAFCEGLPWVGCVTKYHLAKNLGLDVAKPDVHLVRLAAADGTTPAQLCGRIAAATGYRVATVDLILWFACARGVIDSRAEDPFVWKQGA